jgi:hypothetical protein
MRGLASLIVYSYYAALDSAALDSAALDSARAPEVMVLEYYVKS